MPNVIKVSQYNGVIDAGVFHSIADDKKPNAQRQSYSVEEAKDRILDEAMEDAQKAMEAAQLYADKLIQETKQRLKEESEQIQKKSRGEGYRQGVEEGKEAGYQEGYAQGLKAAEEAQQELLDSVKLILQDIEQQKTDILESFSADIQKLAFAIAQKVVKTELSLNEKAMAAIITSATEAYRNQSWMKITVSKNTADLFSDADNPILAALKDVAHTVKIVGSSEMQEGECIIDMPDQSIDAGADTQLDKIKTALQI